MGKYVACSAGVFWVNECLFIVSLRWSRHLWFYDRGRLGESRNMIVTLRVGVRAKKGEGGGEERKNISLLSPRPFPWLAPLPPLFGSFNMALSRLKPFARTMNTPALQASKYVLRSTPYRLLNLVHLLNLRIPALVRHPRVYLVNGNDWPVNKTQRHPLL